MQAWGAVDFRVEHHELLGMLNASGFSRVKIGWYADRHAGALGGSRLFWDEQAFKQAMAHWKNEVVEWSLRARSEIEAEGLPPDDFRDLSFIKYLSVLLWAMTQAGVEPIQAVEVGAVVPKKLCDLLEAYPNEYFSFMTVFGMFHDLEYQRDITSRYDLMRPPMHYRYMRAMTHYLARWRPELGSHSPVRYEDLYLILKTFDLTAMVTDYSK
jgi:hypothetical protein